MSENAPISHQVSVALRSIRSGNYTYAFDICNSLQWGMGLSRFTRARCLFILLLLAPLFPVRVPDPIELADRLYHELINIKKHERGRRNEVVSFMKNHVILVIGIGGILIQYNIKRWARKIEPGASAEKKAKVKAMKEVKGKNEDDSHQTEADQEQIPVPSKDDRRDSVSDDEGVKLGLGDDLPVPDEDEKTLAGLREKGSLN
ncbi:hypothetical protein LTR64_000660 [Lithohypha guttulata]|uniref:uncharacterized protein n=1 Tax=Lithohypha guttulata TaxID=1690604 RepID=UPI002DDEF2DC|nr:hypothetical protein LTR51_005571 [Lithohypha guttulata]